MCLGTSDEVQLLFDSYLSEEDQSNMFRAVLMIGSGLWSALFFAYAIYWWTLAIVEGLTAESLGGSVAIHTLLIPGILIMALVLKNTTIRRLVLGTAVTLAMATMGILIAAFEI